MLAAPVDDSGPPHDAASVSGCIASSAERLPESRFESAVSDQQEEYLMSFQDLALPEPIVRAVEDLGYSEPTPIQSRVIPEVLAGRDVLGCAQTGTGKTGAFAIPILARLGKMDRGRKAPSGRPPRALVLCPTRELATQIFDSFLDYGKRLRLRHAVIYGGVKQGKQVRALKDGLDVLVATPGRLLDLIEQGFVDLSQIETLVLDEADRMLDMGFIHDIRRLTKLIPSDRQTLLLSATISREIRALADSLLTDPVKVQTARESTAAESITQRVYMVKQQLKPVALQHLLRRDEVERALVFTRTKYGADKLVKVLGRSGMRAEAIHSNKSQNQRSRTMEAFRSGRTAVLVATDIASRGIDVDGVTHVVNFDLPMEAETYVHRIGRTARAGSSGIAITLCDRGETKLLRAIERRTRASIEVAVDLPPPPAEESNDEHATQKGTRIERSSRQKTPPKNKSDAVGSKKQGAKKHKRSSAKASSAGRRTTKSGAKGRKGKKGTRATVRNA